MTASLRHVGIVVNDPEEWIEFFVSSLGFQTWVDQIEHGEFISHLLGIPNVEVRTIKLKDEKGGVIELLHFLSPKKNQGKFCGLEPDSQGITHIALEVESISCIIEKIKNENYSPIGSPRVSVNGKVIVCYLRGPEKVLIELVEEIA